MKNIQLIILLSFLGYNSFSQVGNRMMLLKDTSIYTSRAKHSTDSTTTRGLINANGTSIAALTQSASYIIEKRSSTIYARPANGTTLAAYSGSDLATVLNSAINALPSTGGFIYVKPQIDSVSTPIISQSKNNVIIQAEPGTKFISAYHINLPMFRITNVNNWIIAGFEMDGNQANQSAPIPGSASIIPSAVLAEGSKGIIVRQNNIHDFRNTSVWFEGGSSYCQVEYNTIYNIGNGWNGITFGTTSYCTAFKNEVYNFGGLGISSYGKYCAINYNTVHDAINGQGAQAIAIEGGGNTTIDHNVVYNAGIGIYQSGAADATADPATTPYGYNTITNNEVKGWFNSLSNGFYGGIIIQGYTRTKITGNTVIDAAHTMGIWLLGTTNNIVNGNTVVTSDRGINIDANASNNTFASNTIISASGYAFEIDPTSASGNIISADNITTGSFGRIVDQGTGTKIGVVYSGTEQTKLAAISKLPVNSRVVWFGDSQTALGTPAPSGASYFNQNSGYTTFAELINQSNFYTPILGNKGVSFETTTQMLARNGAAIALNPKVVPFLAGTNDLNAGVSVATIEANYEKLVNSFVAAGAKVICVTVLPRYSPNALSTGNEANRLILNTWIKTLADNNNIFVIDAESTMTGMGLYQDGLHPNSLGGYALGKLVGGVMNTLIQTIAKPTDGLTTDNILTQNLYMTGTGGSLSNGATGSVPDNYTLDKTTVTGITASASIGSTNGAAYTQITLGGSYTASGGLSVNLNVNNTVLPAVGDNYEGLVEFEIVTNDPNVMGIDLFSGVFTSGFSGMALADSYKASLTESNPLEINTRYVGRTPTTTVGAGTPAYLLTNLKILLKDQASATPINFVIKIYKEAVRKVPTTL